MRFVNRVARLAEAANHHPDITINYNRVKLALTTHDEGGLTMKDFRLAGRINKLAK
jgi:4a-hydroxytetrahydrobiopterin dehydratase